MTKELMTTAKQTRPECAGACATCPFRRSNFGKPNPAGYDPKAMQGMNGAKYYDWYSGENLRRLWREGISQGEPMICHASDPDASDYGGKPAEPGKERPCAGSLAVVLAHLKYVERVVIGGCNNSKQMMTLYREAAGEYPMTRSGLFEWATMMVIGRTYLFGGLMLPVSLSEETAVACGVPWSDSIANGESGGAQ